MRITVSLDNHCPIRATGEAVVARAVASLLVFLWLACSPTEQRINTDGEGVAILGYDAVAYYTESRAVRGDPNIAHSWRSARWLFSNPTHRDLFAGDPEAYAPQYGGNCAGAMANGRIAKVDPEAWVIVEGKLYLNYDKRYRDQFANDAADQIPRADAEWRALAPVE